MLRTRSKDAKAAKTHRLSKIQRVILADPRLDQLVIDTTGTGHCLHGEYLKDLIKPQ